MDNEEKNSKALTTAGGQQEMNPNDINTLDKKDPDQLEATEELSVNKSPDVSTQKTEIKPMFANAGSDLTQTGATQLLN